MERFIQLRNKNGSIQEKNDANAFKSPHKSTLRPKAYKRAAIMLTHQCFFVTLDDYLKMHFLIKIAPGSDIFGVPASEISEIINPFFNSSKILDKFFFSLNL